MTRVLGVDVGRVGDLGGAVGDLGGFLREQRESAQLSLRQLAAAAGVSNPYLSQVERGLRRPSAEVLQQIAKGLRISAEALYVRAGILEERPGADSEVRAAVLADPYLSERQREVVLEIYTTFRAENARSEVPPAPAPAADGTGSPDGSAPVAPGAGDPPHADHRPARAPRVAAPSPAAPSDADVDAGTAGVAGETPGLGTSSPRRRRRATSSRRSASTGGADDAAADDVAGDGVVADDVAGDGVAAHAPRTASPRTVSPRDGARDENSS